MSTFTEFKSNTGRVFLIRPNHKNRTFTIKTGGTTYRTIKLDPVEFESCLYNTGNDWYHFFNTPKYYAIKL